jgi:DNA-binding beta-propeller fold protein YncE
MIRTGRLGVLTLCVALLAAVSCAASPALASRAHVFSSAFGGAGTVPGEAGSLSLVSEPNAERSGSGIAVNDVTHDVYVADTGNRRIDEFEPEGSAQHPTGYRFLRAWGWGVETGAAKLQVCTTSCKAGLSGSEPGEFEVPSYVAVDNSSSASRGDVYVGDTGDSLVTKFGPEGELETSWGNNGESPSHKRTEPNGQLNGSPTTPFLTHPGFVELSGIADDSTGNLLVLARSAELFEFDQSGQWLTSCVIGLEASAGVGGISMGSSGLFVLDGQGQVQHVGAGCGRPGRVTSGVLEARSVVVDGFDGDIYVDKAGELNGGGELIEDIPAGCVPAPNGCAASQIFGTEGQFILSGASGVAVDPGPGAVYVANAGTDQIAAFKLSIEGETGAAEEVHAHTAVLHGSVNPVGSELTRCVFEYGETESYGSSAPCAEGFAAIGKGEGLVPLQALIAGLEGGKTYFYRLHAVNGVGGVYGDAGHFETSPTALIREVSASEVAGSSALLAAKVNPEGLAAHYHFEYGACASAGECPSSPYTTSFPMPDGTIPAGTEDVSLSQRVEGLTPGTTYHFRVFVEDVNGAATPSPEGTFVFEPGAPACSASRPVRDALLADCREYELVTPPDKDGALVDTGGFLTPPVVALDGSRVLAKSIQCFHGPASCTGIRQTEGEPYAFTRTETGWMTEPLAPSPAAGSTMLSYNADTGSVLYALAATPPALEQFYARRPDGTLTAIGPISEDTGVRVAAVASSVLVTSNDLSHVVFENSGLWPSLESGATGDTVFEYTGTGNPKPELVGVTGPAGSESLISACGTTIGGERLTHSTYNSLSSDGRTVFFTVQPCGSGTGENTAHRVPAFRLYERVEQAAGMASVLVSGSAPEPECDTTCQAQPPGDAIYEGASTDGSRVFFTSTQQLTDGAGEDRHKGDSAMNPGCASTAPSSSGCNLYEFVCPGHCESGSERKLVDVSAGDNSGLGPQVQGVVAVSPDGSSTSFIAHGVLTEKERPGCKAEFEAAARTGEGGCVASPGANNLYVYREGHVVFVATLAESDHREWGGGLGIANVTPDGRFLVFTSHRGLTADVSRREGPAQVYRYDAETGELLRVSVGERGYNDDGNASATDARIVNASAGIAGGDGPSRLNPTMSNDGRYVFFESSAALAPGALNDQHVTGNPGILAENVYEWEAPGAQPSAGAPACSTPGGCVSLISDGQDLNEGSNAHENTSAVELLGTDETGSNVFFWTADQLVGQDTDSQVDLYDARVNGGFAEPVVRQSCGSIEACHPSGAAAPVFSASLASASFVGSGNLAPVSPVKPKPVVAPARKTVKCKAGFVKNKKDVCVKKSRKKSRKKSKRPSRERRSK